jgi:hypothetical protein
MKSEIQNEFPDEATGITYLIPYERQLKPNEAAKIIVLHRKLEKDALFINWEDKNPNWIGEDEEKRTELWEEKHKLKFPILITGPLIELILKADLPTKD